MRRSLTYARYRVLVCIKRHGKKPGNTNQSMLNRLTTEGLVVSTSEGLQLTESGADALHQYEIEEACQALSTRLSSS